MTTLIKTTLDGRKLEVIGVTLCLAGIREADELVPVEQHPNRVAILAAVPGATHVAGRLPLTAEEATMARLALAAGREAEGNTPKALAERIRMTQRNALLFRE